MDILSIYKEILDGKRKQFPLNTWIPTQDAYDAFVRCFRYVVLESLKLNREELLEVVSNEFVRKVKLRTPLEFLYDSNPYKIICSAFPEYEAKPWDLKKSRIVWTDELKTEAIRWLIEERLEWNKEQIIENFTADVIRENGLAGLLMVMKNQPKNLLLHAYPDTDWSEFINRQKLTAKFLTNSVQVLKEHKGAHRTLNEETVREIRAIGRTMPTKDLAERYGVKESAINKVLRYETWKDIR